MIPFLASRLAQLVPTALVITVIVFLLSHLAPGDPVTALAGPEAPPELVAAMRERYGLDRPLWTQYAVWIGRVVRGDMGTSVRTGQPVTTMISERFEATLTLAVSATLFSILIALPAGIMAAARRGGLADSGAMVATSLAISLPNFFTAIVLIVIFGVQLRWLPISGYLPILPDLGGSLARLAMPTISLGLIYTALLSRLVRSDLLDILSEDYIRTARSKGVAERVVLLRHGVRNALLPTINLVTLNFASLLGGTIIIEEIFAIPGIGRLLINAVEIRDFPVIQGVTLTVGVIFILSSILADLLTSFADPRVRL
ncbi:MAG: ABC transporter permease [Truepera sp.]|nr:ABC transporter permease [Truepera sp.]